MELSSRGKSQFDIFNRLDEKLGHKAPTFPVNKSFNGGLQNEGQPTDNVLDALELRLAKDMTYTSGRIFGAMTTQPADFARFVYALYLERNLGDPGLVPGTYEIEQEVIQMLGQLLNAPNVAGNQVSGGTEANLIAMRLAKKISPHIKNPEIVLSESAHYSFEKAADILGLTLRKAQLKADFTIDFDHYKSLINENTIALVGVAGTSSLGIVDPIDKIGYLAREHGLYYHVDGAFGGLELPFLEALGYDIPMFDFRVKEVTSFTVDPHKNLGVIPSGCLLVRDQSLTDYGYSIPYLAGGAVKSLAITGTRPGASAISFWALLQHFGKDGFKRIAKQSMEKTMYLKDALESIPQIHFAIKPVMNILGIQLNSECNLTIEQLDSKLRAKGWALGLFKKYQLLRCVLLPHIQIDHIDAFTHDLREILNE